MAELQRYAMKKPQEKVTIREYRHPGDLAHIRQIFRDATMHGRGSPYLKSMAHFIPHLRLVYSVAILSIVLLVVSTSQWIHGITWITYIVVRRLVVFFGCASFVGRIYVWYWRRKIARVWGVFLEEGLEGELGDVVKSFDLSITEGGVCIPTGPSGFWVAEEGREVIGFVGLNKSLRPDPTVGDVRRLAVAPDHQGKGVAERLMDVLASHARAHHIQALELTTSDYNKSALRFYARIGWKFVGRKDYHGFLLAVMRQELDGVNTETDTGKRT